MRIIAGKNNTLNAHDFFYNGLSKDFIDALSFNVTYTKDNQIILFTNNPVNAATLNTINSSTLAQLKNNEIVLLDDVLKDLSTAPIKKDLYINLTPTNTGVLSDQNINQVTKEMNDYIDALKKIIDQYPNLIINLHSISRNLLAILRRKIATSRIGFAPIEGDSNFIDVDYYVLLSNTQNDIIIDTLLKNNKEVIIYIYSDYYLSYLYNHYLGEKSTPQLNQTFTKLAFMTDYPEVTHRVFRP